MKTLHTPGPWPTRESATHVTVTNASGDAVFHDDKRIPGVMADARLIAAAPELLEALAEISLCSQNSMSSKEECGRIARAAIAKATGENT